MKSKLELLKAKLESFQNHLKTEPFLHWLVAVAVHGAILAIFSPINRHAPPATILILSAMPTIIFVFHCHIDGRIKTWPARKVRPFGWLSLVCTFVTIASFAVPLFMSRFELGTLSENLDAIAALLFGFGLMHAILFASVSLRSRMGRAGLAGSVVWIATCICIAYFKVFSQ